MADSEHGLRARLSPRWIATGVVVGGVVLLAIWLRFGLIGGQTWPVNWLDVVGDLQRTTSGQVRAAVMPHAERGFFAVDLAEVRSAVAALPWVADASVRRVWPDTLEVRVVEHRPVARWNETDLLSQHGEVFTVSGAGALQGLPHLAGPDSRLDEVVAAWKDMRGILAGSGGERIDPLRYGSAQRATTESGVSRELGFLRLRYKAPGEDDSRLIEKPIENRGASDAKGRLAFAAAVAAFGQHLRGGQYLEGFALSDVHALAAGAKGDDPFGYRGEFLQLVRLAEGFQVARN